MKIKIEVDSTIQETEVLIRCAALSSEIVKLEKMLAEYANAPSMLAVYSADKEHYLSMDQLLFFESDGDCIMAHTKEHAYECTYRLYELEAMLPVS
ncbi:MAG: LytTR family DNA-binding domain-containing protein, partial [Erysipelotrichaceae bacterium]